MESFQNANGGPIVSALVKTISLNAKYLSEVDGAIGDGDHGVNMDKGFTRFARIAAGQTLSMSQAFTLLGTTLLTEIGGSMGPLYGSFFKALGRVSAKKDQIDADCFLAMLQAGAESITMIGEAKVGDKTMLDSLIPGVEAFASAVARGSSFDAALQEMATAAERGMTLTREMIARVGRASRLGERSRGVQDAGATSCFLILQSIGQSIKELLQA
jgi:dihydroxyacetone kinase-like protein